MEAVATIPKADEYLTAEELAAALRVCKMTIYRHANAGTLPGRRVGRSWRFRRDVLQLTDNATKGAAEAAAERIPESEAGQ
jgi:excisionase family DNA binding protein